QIHEFCIHQKHGDVFEDYETCIELLIKLMNESSGLTVALYDKEYFYNYAMQTKGKMLRSIKPHLLKEWEKWIPYVDWFMADKAAPEILLSESNNSIKQLDTNVKKMDDNLQNVINKLKEGHVQHFQCLLHEFQDQQAAIIQEAMVADIEKFYALYENVKCKVSDVAVEIASLTELAGSCNFTLRIVEETILMQTTVFSKLLRRSERDLSEKWLEKTHYMNGDPLVRRKKEKYEKARADRDMSWEKIKLSSGLLH
ncbi:hypothetical protein MKX03_020917, partial [Papaver bracteatum]